MSLALLAATAALAANPLPEPAKKLHQERLKVAEEAVQLDAALRKEGIPHARPGEYELAVRSMAAAARAAFESEVALRPDAERQARTAYRQRLGDVAGSERHSDADFPRRYSALTLARDAEDAALAATPAERAKIVTHNRELTRWLPLSRGLALGSRDRKADQALAETVLHQRALAAAVRDVELAAAADGRERRTARIEYFVACRELEAFAKARAPKSVPERVHLWTKYECLGAELAVSAAADRDAVLRDRVAVAAAWRKLDDARLKDGFPAADAAQAVWFLYTWGEGHRAARDAELARATGRPEKKAACLSCVRALAEFEKVVTANVPANATKRHALAAALARLDAELVYVREVGEAPPR